MQTVIDRQAEFPVEKLRQFGVSAPGNMIREEFNMPRGVFSVVWVSMAKSVDKPIPVTHGSNAWVADKPKRSLKSLVISA
jgi:hypothetical protein